MMIEWMHERNVYCREPLESRVAFATKEKVQRTRKNQNQTTRNSNIRKWINENGLRSIRLDLAHGISFGKRMKIFFLFSVFNQHLIASQISKRVERRSIHGKWQSKRYEEKSQGILWKIRHNFAFNCLAGLLRWKYIAYRTKQCKYIHKNSVIALFQIFYTFQQFMLQIIVHKWKTTTSALAGRKREKN